MRFIVTFCFWLVTFSSVNAAVLNVIPTSGVAVELTIQQLDTLPQQEFVTKLPWLKDKHKYQGVKLSDIATMLGDESYRSATLHALNNYEADVPRTDIEQYHPVIVYRVDNQQMSVRDKGPYWLVYDLSRYPELNVIRYQAQMVWQLDEIRLNRDE
jgi:hypothetical protein